MNSWFGRFETDLLKLVRNKNAVNISKLPDKSFLKELYANDEKISPERTNDIVTAYENKVKMFDDFQHGRYKLI